MDVNELREHLATVLADLKSGAIAPERATAIASVAGQVIAASKVQVAYYALKSQRPAIPFLESAKPAPASIVHTLADKP